MGIYVDDDDRSVYVADKQNDRIMQWKYGANSGEVVAGGNGSGEKMNQLYYPTDVVVDKKDDSFIICNYGNKRVVRWSRKHQIIEQILMQHVRCIGLTTDSNGDLYVIDGCNVRVRRWSDGEKEDETIVAGNHKCTPGLNQLSAPEHIFIDQHDTLYVADTYNHRVMKWIRGAKQGIAVAGGPVAGETLSQLSYPEGVTVDEFDNVYVADTGNHRIVRWSKGASKGTLVAGGNEIGEQPDQLGGCRDISFDRDGNLYVIDAYSDRVQKFNVDYD